MAKFRFYQDKEVRTWVRDYFTIEAESLEEAIEYVQDAGCTLEDMECENSDRVEFERRDWDWMYDALADLCDQDDAARYSIFSCDLEDNGEMDCEIAGRY